MKNADPSPQNRAAWPQVTLREILFLVSFFTVLYGLDVMRDDRDGLMDNMVRTPILMGVFVLWRIVQNCRRIAHGFAQVFVALSWEPPLRRWQPCSRSIYAHSISPLRGCYWARLSERLGESS
jgi:hypothetical protein